MQGLAVVAAVVGALAPGAPTGLRPVDAVLQAVLAAIVTLAGYRARRWSILFAAALATASAGGWTFLVAGVALLAGLAVSTRRQRLPLIGAVSTGLTIAALLHQPEHLFQGASVLVGMVAVVPLLVSAHRVSRSARRRRNLIAIGVAGGMTFVAVIAFGVAALLAAPGLRDGADDARAALDAARRGDTGEAEALLRTSSESFRSAQGYVGAIWARPARVVPVLGQHVEAVQVVADQGVAMTEVGSSVARVGDYEDLKYESGRIDLGQVQQLLAPLNQATDVLGTARDEFAGLDRSWLVGPFETELDKLVGEIDRASGEASVAARAVRVAPGLLGADGPRTYFVAFVNPAEERGGGGFLGNYGELTATDGKLELTRSGPIRELISAREPGERSLDGPEDFVARYGQFRPADFFQDVTLSPHFPYTADVISQLYPQSGGTTLDGVISVDPYALAALLEFTGPIDVPDHPEPLTSENAADILLREQYLTFAEDENSLRKDLLVDASEITFDTLVSGSLPGPEQLVEVMAPAVQERRLLLSASDPDEQAFFESMGAGGALPEAAGGDVFMVAHQNFGNSKIDAYLHRDVHYASQIDAAAGTVASTATITMRNEAPAEGLPRIVIGNNRGGAFGTNQMLVSVYSPLALTGASLDGRPLTMVSATEAGLSVYTARIDVAARSTRTLTVELEGGLDLSGDGYDLVVVPQPMVNPDQVSVEAEVSDTWRFSGAEGAGRVIELPDDGSGRPVEVSAGIVAG